MEGSLLLALLLALMLGLLIIGEREKQPVAPQPVVGTLPPPPDPRIAALSAEREALLAELRRDQGLSAESPPDATSEPATPSVLDRQAATSPPVAGEATDPPRQPTTFGGDTVWLAAERDRRAQFYFGLQLFKGRTAPPDRVMAYVWLSRSMDAGYLPAIEMRRRVRAAMSEAEYDLALAMVDREMRAYVGLLCGRGEIVAKMNASGTPPEPELLAHVAARPGTHPSHRRVPRACLG